MHLFEKLNLQFFAGEGASSGGDGSGASGEGANGASAVAEQGNLERLGVPRDKAERYRAIKAKAGVPAQPQQAAAADEPAPEDVREQPAPQENKPQSVDDEWKSLMARPEINRKMAETVNGRLKKANEEKQAMQPMIELLAKQYGIDISDPSKIDFRAVADAVTSDPKYYRDAASEMGTDVDTAMRVTKREREAQMAEQAAKATLEDQRLREHFGNLQAQADRLKQSIPSFDLSRELENPQFLRMTSPEGGLSVEQAFYALHHNEVMNARINQTAQNVSQAISNSIQSGRNMPQENGTMPRAASSVPQKLYSQMTKEERLAYKQKLQSRR